MSHPNLVTLHELCNEGAAWFFTMELVSGTTFDEYCQEEQRTSSIPPLRAPAPTASWRVSRNASITLNQPKIGSELPLAQSTCNMRHLRRALRQLVEGVAALHDAGKLHRDLKPSNVLVTPEGRVVVLDFGLVSNATFIDADSDEAERTIGGCMFGTPAYMSPEQAAGEAVTPASDWYAVGVMVYEALTGQLPFDGSVVEILRQKDTLEPIPPSELVSGVPDDIEMLCRELLRRDPNKRPRSIELLSMLTGHSSPPPVFDAQSSPRVREEVFVGRDSHLRELREAFEASKNGSPVTLLVHGVSGIGKSALVRCFANELIRADEAVVLRGRCYERENVPYKAFDNIIDALSRYMMRLPADEANQILPRNAHALSVLFPVLRRVKAIANARRPKQLTTDARQLRNQAFGALKDLLLRITDFHPLVINIDDLQWADIDSARLLSFLMGPPTPPPLLLIGTYRRDEVEQSPFLRQILAPGGLGSGAAELRSLAVDSLSAEEGAQLAGALLSEMHPQHGLLFGAVAAEADGVPFFITELVQHIRQKSGPASWPMHVDPISLEQVLHERIVNMPPEARTLLEVLSVAGGPIEQGVAIEAAGLARGDRSALLALRAARLIRTRGTRERDTAETYHDRVRETVVHHLDAAQLRQLHGRIAKALEHNDLHDPERLVVHYSGAGDGVRAGETSIEAAHAAARKLAFNRAAELYQGAIALLPADDNKRSELLERLGDALANAGRGGASAEAYLQSAEGRIGAEARRLRRLAAQQYLRSGRVEEGLAIAQTLLQAVGLSLPKRSALGLLSVVGERMRLGMHSLPGPTTKPRAVSETATERLAVLGALFRECSAIEPVLGMYLQSRFLRESLREGATEGVLQGLAWEAINTALTSGSNKRKRIDALLEATQRIATEIGTPHAEATAVLAHAAVSMSLGYPRGVEADAGRAERMFKEVCQGAAWESANARLWRHAGIELSGDLRAFLREAPDDERDAIERGDLYAIGSLALIVPMTHLMRDAPDAALEHLRQQQARLPEGFTALHLWVIDRTTDALLYTGDVKAARAYLDSVWESMDNMFISRAQLLQVNALFLRGRVAVAALQHGEQAMRAPAKKAERKLRALSRPDAETYAGLIAAGVAAADGDERATREHLSNSIRVATDAGIRNFALYAKRNLAWIDAKQGRLSELARVDGELRELGITQPARWNAAYAPGFER